MKIIYQMANDEFPALEKALETECKEAEVSALCALSLATKALVQDKDEAYDLCN